jgi:RsiW-degrading membrane proteinase PrsW (M82 family)
MTEIEIIALLSALIPAVVLLGYIYWQDRKSPEPVLQLLKATALGVLAIPLVLAITTPLESLGILTFDVNTVWDAINVSFLGAAIPEELSKLLILWLFLRNNPYFDERMDGIVYAVCISLGFAGVENVAYVLGDADWMTTALSRAFTAVPGHFCFAVIMGYFYSLAKYEPAHRTRYIVMTIVAPILAHGVYDVLAFSISLSPVLDGFLNLLLALLCFVLWKWASRSIQKHLERR